MPLTKLSLGNAATLAVSGVAIISSHVAVAQTQFLMTDRNADTVWRIRDLNNDGVISDPAEIFAWFSGANVAGTPAPMNFTAQAVSVCRIAIMGDQGLGVVFITHDDNGDGEAQDLGESIVFCGPGNAAGISLAFPTGAGFDNQCAAYVVNAGNASGNDGIYRLVDLNGDGDAMDNVGGVNEITPYVADGPSGFGPGNGPYSPQEIFFDANDVGYLRNSSTGLHGIFRFVDSNNNDRADDAGEFALFFGAGNDTGITVSAGTGLDVDRFVPGAILMQQLATGGIDQIIRARDLNTDNDAQDAGEAAIIFNSAAAGFTSVDIVSLANGDVLVTDNSGITVARLHDGNNDGDFLDAGESTNFVTGPGTILQARQMDALCRVGDVNCDGLVDIDDLLGVINAWGPSGSCTRPNVNCSAGVDIDDLLAVINNWG